MIRIQLTELQRTELQTLRRTDLIAVARNRLEMVLLSDTGWSAPRIAQYLGCHPHTARAALRGFYQHGTASFARQLPGPPPDYSRRQQVTTHLTELLQQDRTWTSRQLAEALIPLGIELSPRQVLRYLARMNARYRRTAQTLTHKQDPQRVELARQTLEELKKSRSQPSETLLSGRMRFLPFVSLWVFLVLKAAAKTDPTRVSARPSSQCLGSLPTLCFSSLASSAVL